MSPSLPVFIITWVVARLTFFLKPAHDMVVFVVVVSQAEEELRGLYRTAA